MKHLLAALLCVAGSAFAMPVTFVWDANPPEEQVISYVLYEQTAGLPVMLAVTAFTTATIDATPGVHTYYVTAQNLWATEDFQDWSRLLSRYNITGEFNFIDPHPGRQRFYRAELTL